MSDDLKLADECTLRQSAEVGRLRSENEALSQSFSEYSAKAETEIERLREENISSFVHRNGGTPTQLESMRAENKRLGDVVNAHAFEQVVFRAEHMRMHAEIERLRGLIRDAEWGHPECHVECPWCMSSKWSNDETPGAHADPCPIRDILAQEGAWR